MKIEDFPITTPDGWTHKGILSKLTCDCGKEVLLTGIGSPCLTDLEKALTAYRIQKETNEGKERKALGVVNGEITELHLYWDRGSWAVVAVIGKATITGFFDNYEEAVKTFEFIKGGYGMK